MNQLAQILNYLQKVFALPAALRGVRDTRPYPVIPLPPVLLSLLLGVVMRVSSHLELSQQTNRRRWQHLVGAKGPISHDTFAYVTERLVPEDLRGVLAAVNQRLKANKSFETCKLQGLLWLSLDANEHFGSRSGCCSSCCQRRVTLKDRQGQTREVTEYYHRYVFAHISGPNFHALLDLEPIRPGEDEAQAALRLLGRIRRLYGVRFFQGVTLDGWYVQGPFLRAVEKLGWLLWVVVLKQERLGVFQEAQGLMKLEPLCQEFHDQSRDRDVRLWEAKEMEFSEGYGRKVWVVRSEESWKEKRRVGGKKVGADQRSQWYWMAAAEGQKYGAKLVYQAGHRRWGVENQAFNQLTQFYHLEHCYHHEAVAMLVQMLILLLGFTLFTAFAKLHSQLVRLEKTSLKELTRMLDLALEEDLPWEQWFNSG